MPHHAHVVGPIGELLGHEEVRMNSYLRIIVAIALAALVPAGTMMAGAPPKHRVLVWCEGTAPKNVYPNEINSAIADGLRSLKGWEVVTASLNDADQGLSKESLDRTDVIIWWGHVRHGEVSDEAVARVVERVKSGKMGFIATHSSHWSKPFMALMGTSGTWKGGYNEDGSKVDVTVAAPTHPVAKGIKDFSIPHTERYIEPFDVPAGTIVFGGTYTLPNGTKQPSVQGLAWTIGKGRVFYFQPGHESYPIYYQPEVQQVFRNAVLWVAPKR